MYKYRRMTITFIVARLFLEGNDLFVYIEHKLILYTKSKNPNKQLKNPKNCESNKGRLFSGTKTLGIFNQKAIKVSLCEWIVDTVNMSRKTDF